MPKRPPRSVTPRWTLPRSALAALLPVMLAHAQPALADCATSPTTGDDTIVCSDSNTTPVEGGAGNDRITNNGTVTATQTITTASPPPLPDFQEFGSGTVDYEATAGITAISGGAGNDVIDNAGTSTATVSATLQTITAPVTLAGGDVVSATNTVAATATGIAGDAGADTITSHGQVEAEATAELLNVNVEHNFADTSRVSVSTT